MNLYGIDATFLYHIQDTLALKIYLVSQLHAYLNEFHSQIDALFP